MTKKEALRQVWKDNRNFNKKKASEEIPLDISTIFKYIKDFEREEGEKPMERTKSLKRFKSGGGLEAFRNRYDDSIIIPSRIEEGIKKYLRSPSGEPDWMKDKNFREACGVSVGKWRRYADDYKDLQVNVNGEVIWGHPDIIEEMRRAVQR